MKHAPRLFMRILAAAAGAALVLFTGVYLLRGVLIAPRIQHFMAQSIQSHLGMQVAIGAVSGSFVTDIKVTGITTLTPSPYRGLRSLACEQLTISGNPFALLRGMDAFLGTVSIEIDAAHLTVDLSDQAKNRPAPAKTEPSAEIARPRQLPRITIENAACRVRGPDYEANVQGIDLTTRPGDSAARRFHLAITRGDWTHPALKSGHTPVSADIAWSPDRVVVDRITLGGQQPVASFGIGLDRLPRMIPFNAALDLGGGRVSLDGRLDDVNLNARLQADNLDIARIGTLFSPPGPPLAGSLSMTATVAVPRDRPLDLTADLDLHLTRGRFRGRTVDRIDLRAGAQDGRLHIAALDLLAGGNTAALRDIEASARAVFAADIADIIATAAGRFSLDCRDVPAVMALAGRMPAADLGTLPAHRLSLDGEINARRVLLTRGRLATDHGTIDLLPGHITLPPPDRPFRETEVTAGLHVDLPALDRVGRLFAMPAIGGRLQADATVSGTLGAPVGEAVISASRISFQGQSYGDLRVTAAADARTITIRSAALQHGPDRLDGQGTYVLETRQIADGRLDFRFDTPGPYIAALWPSDGRSDRTVPQVSGQLAGTLTFAGHPAMPEGAAAVTARNLRIGSTPVGDADLRLQAAAGKIRIDTLAIRQAKDRAALTGAFDLNARQFEKTNLTIAIADLSVYTRQFFPDLPTAGTAIRATVDLSGPIAAPEARADVLLDRLTLGTVSLPSARLTARSSGRRLSIDLLRAATPIGDAALSGHLERGPDSTDVNLQLTGFSLSGPDHGLTLEHPGRLHFSMQDGLVVEDIRLQGPTGRIRLQGSVTAGQTADLDLQVTDLDSRGWLEALVPGQIRFSGLDARIRVAGPLDAPAVSATGRLNRLAGHFSPTVLAGRFDLSYGSEGLAVRQFDWQDENGQTLAATGRLPVNLFRKPLLRPGPLAFDASVSLSDPALLTAGHADRIPLAGDLKGRLQLAGTWQAPVGTAMFQYRGQNRPQKGNGLPPGPVNLDGRLRLNGSTLDVESLRLATPFLNVTCQGKWIELPAINDLFQGKIGMPAGSLALTGHLDSADISWIAGLTPALRRSAGRIEADLDLGGDLSDPSMEAFVRLADAELRPEMDMPALQALNAEARVTPDGIRLKRLTGELGGAPFQITGSVTRSAPGGILSDLRFKGTNLLLHRSADLKLRADVDLTVQGPFNRLEIAGKTAISDGHLSKTIDLLGPLKGGKKPGTTDGLQLFSIQQPPLSDMVFDLAIGSANPFLIRNNLVKGAVRPELTLTGTGEFPILSGKVYVDPTTVSLPAGRLVFESGVIRFDPNRPDRPFLDILGSSRMLGYDITVLVEGPYDEPVVTLSSTPPLSSQELLLLLLTGRQPETIDSPENRQRQSLKVAVFIGRDLFSRWFGTPSTENPDAFAERFEIQTGRAVTRAGEETIDARFRVAGDVLRDGDTLYITGEKDTFDFYNVGVKIVFRFK